MLSNEVFSTNCPYLDSTGCMLGNLNRTPAGGVRTGGDNNNPTALIESKIWMRYSARAGCRSTFPCKGFPRQGAQDFFQKNLDHITKKKLSASNGAGRHRSFPEILSKEHGQTWPFWTGRNSKTIYNDHEHLAKSKSFSPKKWSYWTSWHQIAWPFPPGPTFGPISKPMDLYEVVF